MRISFKSEKSLSAFSQPRTRYIRISVYIKIRVLRSKTMSDITYELAVVGGGLIGSSAAKHLSGSSGSGSVCLIGPEDNNDETHGAWFDEGRLTRGVDNNPYWTALCE